jgi:hypothetical protein
MGPVMGLTKEELIVTKLVLLLTPSPTVTVAVVLTELIANARGLWTLVELDDQPPVEGGEVGAGMMGAVLFMIMQLVDVA